MLELNPSATLLLCHESRPPPASAPAGTDHARDFFDAMGAGCELEQVPSSEIEVAWRCDEITLWRMRARRRGCGLRSDARAESVHDR